MTQSTPNYLTPQSARLEQVVAAQLRPHTPARVVGLPTQRCADLASKGWTDPSLDQLGVDFAVVWSGVTWFIDVTVGKSTVIKNKKAKFATADMQTWLAKNNAIAVVLTCRDPEKLINKSALELIARAPVCKTTGVIDCRIN